MTPRDKMELMTLLEELLAQYLKLTGGTMSGPLYLKDGYGTIASYADSISLHSFNARYSTSNERALSVRNSTLDDLKGTVKLNDISDGEANSYNIFGEHNKPSGTYTGNGDAAERTVDVGGIGNICVVTASNGPVSFVTVTGAFTVGAGQLFACKWAEAHFVRGVLTFATTNEFFNGAGITYSYNLL